jgi:acylphosphatase
MARAQAHVYVSGRVQGVFFRAFVSEKAMDLGLTGWVRNLPDGRVEAVFEGEEEQIKETIARCREGPPHSVVRDVNVTFEKPTGKFSSFVVTY